MPPPDPPARRPEPDRTGAHEPGPAGGEVAAGRDPTSTVKTDARPGAAGAAPARIGRFEIKAVLGEGAFGVVYRGFDAELGRDVAIKVPRGNTAAPGFKDNFLREARAAAALHHPNICPVYQAGADGDVPFLVMHFVSGPTLASLIEKRKGPFPIEQAAVVVRKLALGVAAAHARDVIHRDLKPANVLVDEVRREVLITDFGVARVGNTGESVDGEVVGTPAYMSPEQARGLKDKVGKHSDVYSLGVILYRLLTGRVPFTG
ncbi:MAG: serine/threonine-protein kinase, partial [Gemmata sp.]